MQSAPHTMPAMIEVNLPAGFTAPDPHPCARKLHMFADQLRKTGLLSQFQHRHQSRRRHQFRSSNTAESTVNVCDDCIESAFQNSGQMRLQ